MMLNLFQKIPSITTAELANKLNQSIVLLDVRNPDEYRMGHISQAINYPFGEIKNYQGHEEVYLICQAGVRSKRAARILKQKGYSVINVEGGMNRWQGPIKGGK
ncbi:rhodanese-like domain-containing protein [Enterococcus pseudoavium]|uniref:Rhodanese-like domain-containing protein n=2 Tax=Enterococcus pseudoavium TaxID=44007 RepID=A0ABU3FKM4_9ENTE|nr:rhodanese-like domain-containing protein [Enterococcus pseudoavium]MDT2755673.1 rhodanese-like domain-containing protein [Enterococcus pseudoavium]MDT2771621.1 rhodanese-like domain-containing protein [Enterococcus pseudoavium]